MVGLGIEPLSKCVWATDNQKVSNAMSLALELQWLVNELIEIKKESVTILIID